MTDDKDEEPIVNPTNTQKESSSDEIIPPKDIEIITATKESVNMEVHHHPDLHHKSN
jgi:hypothetical protein